METNLLKITVLFIILIAFFFPLTAQGVEIKSPLAYSSFQELINRIIDFIFWIAISIAPIIIIVGGFYFLTAAGDPEKINTAKKIILWALIGLLIIISAKGLITLFREIFLARCAEYCQKLNYSGSCESNVSGCVTWFKDEGCPSSRPYCCCRYR